jgi:hypothetical protein
MGQLCVAELELTVLRTNTDAGSDLLCKPALNPGRIVDQQVIWITVY